MDDQLNKLLKDIRKFIQALPGIGGVLEIIIRDAGMNPDMMFTNDMVVVRKIDTTIRRASQQGKLPLLLQEVEDFFIGEIADHKHQKISTYIHSYEQIARQEDIQVNGSTKASAEPTFPSRAPITLAIEVADDPIREELLLKTERHLTITLTQAQVHKLAQISQQFKAQTNSLEQIYQLGKEAWFILSKAERRLISLLKQAAQSEYPQPIAWAGKVELLIRIYTAISIAYAARGEEDHQYDFLSLKYGNPYFYPLFDASFQRSLRKRTGDYDDISLRVESLVFDQGELKEEDAIPAISKGLKGDVFMMLGHEINQAVKWAVELLDREGDNATRLLMSLGKTELTAELLHQSLSRFPCVVFGMVAENEIHKDFSSRLEKMISRNNRLADQAPSSIISAAKAQLLKEAVAHQNLTQIKAILNGSVWSWVGRPLFSNEFGELIPSVYPHLMDLRSVSSKEWYYNRTGGIPEEYRAEELLNANAQHHEHAKETKFHFYLTGAGGTGKSCFLRYVYEKMEVNHPHILPVWYKVDAPGRVWNEVVERIKEESAKALGKRLKKSTSKMLPPQGTDLDAFLKQLMFQLKAENTGIQEIVIFIDQLERTFESGDHPDLVRLKEISKQFINLLKGVGIGQGIRIFIASRKQYLPDFLGSYRESARYGLQFNVLQKISSDDEQIGFIEKIQKWCKEKELIDKSLEINRDAARVLGDAVEGHPMNLMLALIQIFSEQITGVIDKEKIEALKPQEQLFYLDEQLAAKDAIDWYFMLAMAHAKAEIVRFEEVWWRIQLIDPRMTRRLKQLGQKGLLERLWLLGFLGRTLNTRPAAGKPERLLEFFHANLRDHLIRNVMNHGGGEWRIKGRKSGTPAVWRALDRLLAAARDWEQAQQLLPKDDIRLLLSQKEIFVETLHRERDLDESISQESSELPMEVEAFYLLFLRDAKEVREKLFLAAKECIVFSAVVHEEFGHWAFRKLMPKIADRIQCTNRWLMRCDADSRVKLFQYLMELNHTEADLLIATFVFDQRQFVQGEEVWPQIANILLEPLYAERYRGRITVAVLQYAMAQRWEMPQENWQTERFGAFCATACAGDRSALIKLMEDIAEQVSTFQHSSLSALIHELLHKREWMNAWLKDTSVEAYNLTVHSRALHGNVPPRIELRAEKSVADLIQAKVEDWNREIYQQIGLPLPSLTITHWHHSDSEAHTDSGSHTEWEADPFEVELRIDGRSIARGDFYPHLYQSLKRMWTLKNIPLPPDRQESEHMALNEVVVWAPLTAIKDTEMFGLSIDFEQAMLEWTCNLMREQMEHIFGFEDLSQFLQSIADEGDARLNMREFLRTISGNFSSLWRVLVNLAKEQVPIYGRKVELMLELQRLVGESNNRSNLFFTQKLRELVKQDLCKRFADEYNQLSVILLDQELEEKLMMKLLGDKELGQLTGLALTTAEVLALTSAIRSQFEKDVRTTGREPVFVCRDDLRFLLFSILHPLDKRMKVLSFTELSTEVSLSASGFVPDLLKDA